MDRPRIAAMKKIYADPFSTDQEFRQKILVTISTLRKELEVDGVQDFEDLTVSTWRAQDDILAYVVELSVDASARPEDW